MEGDGKAVRENRRWSMLSTIRRAKSEDFRHSDCPPDIPEGEEPPLTPRSSHSILSHPSTPPKKIWERQYRSFLKKKDSGQNFSDVDKLDDVQVSIDHPFSTQKHKFFLTSLSKTRSNSDTTVKGGNIFSNAFPKDSSRGSVSSLSRQTRSMDTLDTSLRRGHEKGSSPKIQRQMNLDISGEILQAPILPFHKVNTFHTSSLVTMQSAQASAPSNLSLALKAPDNKDFESESHSINENNTALPSGLAKSIKQPTSTEMKKAFTQFHNSQAYAKDSTSAFLGEDSSVYGNAFFGVYNQSAVPHKESE
jgi:hypothetical protein